MKRNDEKNPRKAHAACSEGKKLLRRITDTRNLWQRKNEHVFCPKPVGKHEKLFVQEGFGGWSPSFVMTCWSSGFFMTRWKRHKALLRFSAEIALKVMNWQPTRVLTLSHQITLLPFKNTQLIRKSFKLSKALTFISSTVKFPSSFSSITCKAF